MIEITAAQSEYTFFLSYFLRETLGKVMTITSAGLIFRLISMTYFFSLQISIACLSANTNEKLRVE